MATLLAVLTAGSTFAGNPSGTGQPNASCEDSSTKPPGFSSDGLAIAEVHYAGNGDPSLNANSGNAVSQYDVACFQQFSH